MIFASLKRGRSKAHRSVSGQKMPASELRNPGVAMRRFVLSTESRYDSPFLSGTGAVRTGVRLRPNQKHLQPPGRASSPPFFIGSSREEALLDETVEYYV